MRVIWRYTSSISRKIDSQVEEINFRGRVVGWRKRRASVVVVTEEEVTQG